MRAGSRSIVEGKSAREIFGPIDEMKFRSSMTLFARRGRGRRPVSALPRQIFRGRSGPADTGANMIGLLSPPSVFCWRGMAKRASNVIASPHAV